MNAVMDSLVKRIPPVSLALPIVLWEQYAIKVMVLVLEVARKTGQENSATYHVLSSAGSVINLIHGLVRCVKKVFTVKTVNMLAAWGALQDNSHKPATKSAVNVILTAEIHYGALHVTNIVAQAVVELFATEQQGIV